MGGRYSRSQAAYRERRAAEAARSAFMQANQERPHYAVGTVGTGRWYWVVWPCAESAYGYGAPASVTGYASDKATAEQAARRAGGVVDFPAGWATAHHRRCCVAARAARPGPGTTAAPLEFLYTSWTDEYDGRLHSSPHRIVKRTARRVYVERDRYQPDAHQCPDTYDVQMITLDRVTLERNGGAWSQSSREYYATTPVDERPPVTAAPPCLTALGLPLDCTAADVRRVYRRQARELHPDAGGDPQAFIALQRVYEQALATVGV